ncbi:Threonylcarbamoyl-AMP synthase [Beijerinckiaceae bacterium RH AL1]|nr:L-threonylcarbamoyladenylate synthase [Beijerinckiaceae bacterium]VVB43282.1 Threonylcarbamoyl-AMP synthase [Beijerinckiaceae bacterium RH AL8]VVB43297.1 Threonylcarbamoyl-AMP synthase [Beijerinckiaceae bacterium RH CH11]VVC53762.1 Threonylcarbamoyl-AMP synthase [Beijerinckiaceae bacterium RH AL1]
MTATDHDIADAARLLRDGRLVAFPTETVYGLGADATSPEAVARIYAAKGRPQFNPLIAHVASIEAAAAEGELSPAALALAERFWPGPLTLVVPRRAGGTVCDLACAGLASVGLRMPSHPLALALLRDAGRPVAAPSANRSGRLSPTTAADVVADLGAAVDLVLDGGPCPVGVESTIVGFNDGTPVLLRPGGIAREAIETVLARPLAAPGPEIAAPGMLASHYAPNAQLQLDATSLEPDDIGLDFGGALPGAALDLSPRGDLAEAAANLYAYLRQLDARAPARIAVAPIPAQGLGLAIGDRLRRAAAPRPT